MKQMNSADMQRIIENAIGDLDLVQPSTTLDKKIRNLVDQAPALQDDSTIVISRFSWPAFIATALSACLLGILMGRFSVESESTGPIVDASPRVVAAALPEKNNLPQQTMASTEVKLGGFGLLHGHSGQTEFADCSTCHVTTKNWKAENPHFYDRKPLRRIQHIMNCKSCHVTDGFWNG